MKKKRQGSMSAKCGIFRFSHPFLTVRPSKLIFKKVYKTSKEKGGHVCARVGGIVFQKTMPSAFQNPKAPAGTFFPYVVPKTSSNSEPNVSQEKKRAMSPVRNIKGAKSDQNQPADRSTRTKKQKENSLNVPKQAKARLKLMTSMNLESTP